MAGNGGPISVSDGNYTDVIENGKGLSIVDFWAAWCGPCRMVAPVIEQLAKDFDGRMQVAKLDVDANQQVAESCGVTDGGKQTPIADGAIHLSVEMRQLVGRAEPMNRRLGDDPQMRRDDRHRDRDIE